MTAAEQDANESKLQTPAQETKPVEWLTDVIDQWKRNAFQRALERRHAAGPHRVVVESAHLVRTSSS